MTNDFYRNKPYYQDETDFTTNAESYYKDLARKQKLIKLLAEKIWKYENTLKESLESIEKRLTDYIAENDQVLKDMLQKWDDRIANLDKEVSHIFVEWLNDGTLEEIINHDVLGNKADKTYVDDLNENVTAQLAQTAINVLNPIGNLIPAVGDGINDDTEAIQTIINYAISNGYNVFIPKPKNNYLITNNVMIENVEGFLLTIDHEAIFKTTGDYEGINIYPSFSPAPMYRTIFTVINSKHVTISGGVFDCSGFNHPGDGRTASAILALESEYITVEKTKVNDLAPKSVWSTVWDTVDGKSRPLQYIGILGVKVKSMTIQDNYAKNIAYSAYETKIACTDSKFINNYAENCAQHLIQPTPSYINVDILPEDFYNHGSLIANNTGKGITTDITTHGTGVSIIGNTLIDVTQGRSISLRANTFGATIIGNTLICTGEKGDVGIQIEGGRQSVIEGNVFINYVKAFDEIGGDSSTIFGSNVFRDVDDKNINDLSLGKTSGLNSKHNRLISIGGEAGYNSMGVGNSVYLGFSSGADSNGNDVTAIGDEAAYGNMSDQLSAFGNSAGKNNTGLRSTLIGNNAGQANTGANLVAIGLDAGRNNTGDNSILIGRYTRDNPFNNVTGLGAKPTSDNQVKLGGKHIELSNIEEPSTPPTLNVRIYFRDNQLVALFPNGKRVVIADNTL